MDISIETSGRCRYCGGNLMPRPYQGDLRCIMCGRSAIHFPKIPKPRNTHPIKKKCDTCHKDFLDFSPNHCAKRCSECKNKHFDKKYKRMRKEMKE